MPFHLTHNPLWEKHYHFRLQTGHWVEKWSNICKVAQLAKGRAKVHTQLWLMAKPYPLPHMLLPFPVAAGSGTDQSFVEELFSLTIHHAIIFIQFDSSSMTLIKASKTYAHTMYYVQARMERQGWLSAHPEGPLRYCSYNMCSGSAALTEQRRHTWIGSCVSLMGPMRTSAGETC